MDDLNTGAGADPALTVAAVMAELEAIIGDIIGVDVLGIVGFRPQSQFVADLQMDSIQLVAFASRVGQRYGENLDVNGWLASKPLRQIIKLTVGQVAEFIVVETTRLSRR